MRPSELRRTYKTKRNQFVTWKKHEGRKWRLKKYFTNFCRCERCSRVMSPPFVWLNRFVDGKDYMATVDHILPLGMGGKNEESNFRLICFKCNNERDKIMESPFYKASVKLKSMY